MDDDEFFNDLMDEDIQDENGADKKGSENKDSNRQKVSKLAKTYLTNSRGPDSFEYPDDSQAIVPRLLSNCSYSFFSIMSAMMLTISYISLNEV